MSLFRGMARIFGSACNYLWLRVAQYDIYYFVEVMEDQSKRLKKLRQDSERARDLMLQLLLDGSTVNPMRSGQLLFCLYGSVLRIVKAELRAWLLRLIVFVLGILMRFTNPSSLDDNSR